MINKQKIAIFGGGAVGQCIAYSLYKAGHNYAFIDKSKKVLENKNFHITHVYLRDGGKKVVFHEIPALYWKNTKTTHPLGFLLRANFIFISVGISNIKLVSRFLFSLIGKSKHRPHIIFFENDPKPEEDFLNEFPNYPAGSLHFSIPDIISYRQENLAVRALHPYTFFLDNKRIIQKLNSRYFKYKSGIKVAYFQRLYSHNTAHNMIAYLGHKRGYKTIGEAIKDEWIKKATEGALREASVGLCKKHGLTINGQIKKADLEIKKLLCENFEDPILRVGRSPLRKLRLNDRLVGPALLAYEAGVLPKFLCLGIAHLLLFKNDYDKESKFLTKLLNRYGVGHVLHKYAALDKNHPISLEIKKIFEEISFNSSK